MPHPTRIPSVDYFLILTVSVAITVLARTLAAGDGPGADTIFWAPKAGNGITTADWPVAVVWLNGLGLNGAWVLLRTSNRGRTVLVASTAVLITFITFTLLKGDGPDSGRSILAISAQYGVNSGDLVYIGIWFCGCTACAAILARPREHHSASPE